MHERILEIALAVRRAHRLPDLYADNPGFRALCDDLGEVLTVLSELRSDAAGRQTTREYDRLALELADEIRTYLLAPDWTATETGSRQKERGS